MAVVKAVSFQEEVLKYAKEEAKEIFGDNLSAFITFLICNYKRNQPKHFDIDKELGEELGSCFKRIGDKEY